jgi:hypothetical protein
MFSIEKRPSVVGDWFQRQSDRRFHVRQRKIEVDILIQDSLLGFLCWTGTESDLLAVPDAPPGDGLRHFSPFDPSD